MRARQRVTLLRCTVQLAAALSGACAAEAAQAPPTAAASRYEGKCAFLGLEEVAGPGDQNSDSVWLVASYQFPEHDVPAPKQPLSLKFRVERSRIDDLRAHLEQHPNVICHPESAEPATGSNYRVEVPPFDGQGGEPVR